MEDDQSDSLIVDKKCQSPPRVHLIYMPGTEREVELERHWHTDSPTKFRLGQWPFNG
jgi:hypothetical protein